MSNDGIRVDLNDPESVGAALQALGSEIRALKGSITELALLLGLSVGVASRCESVTLAVAMNAAREAIGTLGQPSGALRVLGVGLDAGCGLPMPPPDDGGKPSLTTDNVVELLRKVA